MVRGHTLLLTYILNNFLNDTLSNAFEAAINNTHTE